MSKHAKVLTSADLRRVLHHISNCRYPERSRVMVLLSFKAGLRAAEIAGLEWSMVLGPNGRLTHELDVSALIAKNGRNRRVPINPELRTALLALRVAMGRPEKGPIIRSERGEHMTSRSVVNWFSALYHELEFQG